MLKEKLKMMNGVLENGNYQLGQFKFGELRKSQVVRVIMIKFLNDIRNVEKPISNNRKIINTIAVLFLGIALGTFSKFLDFRQAELPSGLMAIDAALDVHNFLGRFAIWVLIALCISIYSNSAIRASINVFAFFIGMVASYYLYSNYIAGFFPRSYAVIWFGFTAVSPLLSFVCWYASTWTIAENTKSHSLNCQKRS